MNAAGSPLPQPASARRISNAVVTKKKFGEFGLFIFALEIGSGASDLSQTEPLHQIVKSRTAHAEKLGCLAEIAIHPSENAQHGALLCFIANLAQIERDRVRTGRCQTEVLGA